MDLTSALSVLLHLSVELVFTINVRFHFSAHNFWYWSVPLTGPHTLTPVLKSLLALILDMVSLISCGERGIYDTGYNASFSTIIALFSLGYRLIRMSTGPFKFGSLVAHRSLGGLLSFEFRAVFYFAIPL